jgi:transcriptional regulator with XRE-family HTH domain
MTQSRLAQAIGVSGPTLNNWFTGRYAPRSPADIERLARVLQLTALEADVLLYSVNPAWVKYQTPAHVLAAYEVNRYWERIVPDMGVAPAEPPPVDEIEASWPLYFDDAFASNGNHWGLGSKDDGVCMVDRRWLLSPAPAQPLPLDGHARRRLALLRPAGLLSLG